MSSPVYQPNPLTGLKDQIRAHWKEHRPAMYRALQQSFELNQAISKAAELTKEAFHSARHSGKTWDQAWELVREEWALLPPSKEPDLPFSLESETET